MAHCFSIVQRLQYILLQIAIPDACFYIMFRLIAEYILLRVQVHCTTALLYWNCRNVENEGLNQLCWKPPCWGSEAKESMKVAILSSLHGCSTDLKEEALLHSFKWLGSFQIHAVLSISPASNKRFNWFSVFK